MEKRRNRSQGAISPLFHIILYIFLTSGVKLHIQLLNVVVQFIVSSLSQLWYVEIRISQSVSMSPLEFEITRVDCNTDIFTGERIWYFHWWKITSRCYFHFLITSHVNIYFRRRRLQNNSLETITTITKTRLFKYIENFTTKNWKFSDKNLIFFIFLLKTYCGYSLEPPRRGGSNEYHNLCFDQKYEK